MNIHKVLVDAESFSITYLLSNSLYACEYIGRYINSIQFFLGKITLILMDEKHNWRSKQLRSPQRVWGKKRIGHLFRACSSILSFFPWWEMVQLLVSIFVEVWTFCIPWRHSNSKETTKNKISCTMLLPLLLIWSPRLGD